ncbi:unnamed protein product [Durusdinium trenchii]|uniref:C3H1-type domain-containing protein n=2 Tax=Durusdinium trenchii TaxID=1381693 RepID=A0ABP0QAY9_9DINO
MEAGSILPRAGKDGDIEERATEADWPWNSTWKSDGKGCDECSSLCKFGWHAPNGQYYCKTCWDHWHTLPASVPVHQRSRDNELRVTRPPKRGFRIFNGCACCDPAQQQDARTRMASPLYRRRHVEELQNLSYCDAHCHLDILLHNLKNGGKLWGGKEKLCKMWITGDCWYGRDCEYAHGEHELVPREVLSREHVEKYLLEVRTNPQHASLKWLVTNCCELDAIEDTKIIIECADQLGLNSVYCTLGCHPHDYRDFTEEAEKLLRNAIQAFGKRMVAVGECGLDYWKNFDESCDEQERARMLDVFARQVRMGVDYDLPVVVHARDADGDTLEVLKQFLPKEHKVYIHAYQGGLQMMNDALLEFPNCVFGVSSMVWCSEGAKATAIHCPLQRMVLETDAPYLASEPFDIPALAERVAELKGVTLEEVLRVTLEVSQNFYGLG